jgi:hypothetical protein
VSTELSLPDVISAVGKEALPLIKQTLQQKWLYSHYIHGKNAFEAGKVAGIGESVCRQVAAATEIVWAAILVLDDIMDGDEVRYHAPSAWKAEGYSAATGEMTLALLEGIRLVNEASLRDSLLNACASTVHAMRMIARLSPVGTLADTEAPFRQLGSLSAFAVAWPWRDSRMWRIAELETCAGQLVNDCNDCFGAKAVRRGYPDIRNRQVSLLLAIIHEHYKRRDLAERVAEAVPDQCAAIAQDMHDVVRKSPEGILATFNGWMDEAMSLAMSLESKAVQKWTTDRVENNRASWEIKLVGLLSGESP